MAATNGSKRAVLYLSMSSDKQETSIDDQRAELHTYAKKHGYVIVGEYLDEAISGDDTERRTGFLQMREDTKSRKFDLVLCWDQDRFGRFDLLDAGKWIAPFRDHGVRLETIAQGRIDWEDLVGQLIYSVNQMGKAQFLRDLSRNTVRGMLSSARNGTAGTGGPSPYGYHSQDGVVKIIADEAEVVRMIFAEYLKPKGSIRAVAAELNRRQVAPPRGKVWRMSSVRAILERRKYTGSFIYGQQNAGKYYCWRDGEIVPRRKNEKATQSDPIVHENKFEGIISQETFDKTQIKLAVGKGNTAPRKARQYLLSGLVKCGDCGGAMGGRRRASGAVYRCRQYHQTGTATCYCNTVPEAPLVSVIIGNIQDKYLSESAIARLRVALEKEQERTKPRPRDLKRLKSEVEKYDRKIDIAEEAVLESPPDLRPGLYRKLGEFKSERDRLSSDLEALSRRDTMSTGKDDSEIDRAIEILKNLGEAFKRAQPEDTRELLGSIVTRIDLRFDHEET